MVVYVFFFWGFLYFWNSTIEMYYFGSRKYRKDLLSKNFKAWLFSSLVIRGGNSHSIVTEFLELGIDKYPWKLTDFI